MDLFPSVDPIPLTAPVWLFKALHILTLVLHFCAVYLLVGGLTLATWWRLRGCALEDPVRQDASRALTQRLPTVMAYVINLGIPPLLFTQVLYGRALYTSSILVGIAWISVILLLIVSYFLLYRMARPNVFCAWHIALGGIALLLVLKIGLIYSHNMTLMLMPDRWREFYRTHPHGMVLDPGNPMALSRWLFMMTTAFVMSGAALQLLARRHGIAAETAAFLNRRGALLMRVFIVIQAVWAWMVLRSQPEAAREALLGSSLNLTSGVLWSGATAVLLVLAWLNRKQDAPAAWPLVIANCAVAFVSVLSLVIFRDGIRDANLAQHGYDVWDRTVNANWPVIGVFLFLFVVMAGSIGWMISVVVRAKGVDEDYA